MVSNAAAIFPLDSRTRDFWLWEEGNHRLDADSEPGRPPGER